LDSKAKKFFFQVFPISRPPKDILIDKPLQKEFNCSDLTSMMKEFFKSHKYAFKLVGKSSTGMAKLWPSKFFLRPSVSNFLYIFWIFRHVNMEEMNLKLTSTVSLLKNKIAALNITSNLYLASEQKILTTIIGLVALELDYGWECSLANRG